MTPTPTRPTLSSALRPRSSGCAIRPPLRRSKPRKLFSTPKTPLAKPPRWQGKKPRRPSIACKRRSERCRNNWRSRARRRRRRLQRPTSKAQRSTSNSQGAGATAARLGRWELDVGSWMLGVGCWELDVGSWMLPFPGPMMKLALCVFLGLTLFAFARDRGVIHDPDGYVNVRAQPNIDAAIVATVKNNQPFEFEAPKEVEEWLKVKLESGETGWMHGSRIVLY